MNESSVDASTLLISPIKVVFHGQLLLIPVMQMQSEVM